LKKLVESCENMSREERKDSTKEKGNRSRGPKNQKARNARPKAQKTPGQERYNNDAPGTGSTRNKDGQENRRNNGRRRGDGKFGRRLRQPAKGGRKSNEPSPAGSNPKQPPVHPGPLRLPPTTSPMTTPWNNRRQTQQPKKKEHGGPKIHGGRKPSQHTGNPRLDQQRQKEGQNAQDWTAQPEGLTDLSRKKYSVPWLLERRDNEKAKECSFQLPNDLSLANLSPTLRARRYPFKTARPNRPFKDGGREDELPAWMADEDDLDKDFTFKVLEEGDREHFLKFGRAKNEKELKVISPAEHEAIEKAKVDAANQAHQEEFLKPVTNEDIFQAFSSEKAANNDDFDPDSMFAAEAPQPPKKPEPQPKMVIDEIVMNRSPNPKVATKASVDAVEPSSQANYLQSFMKKPNVNKPPDHTLRPGAKRVDPRAAGSVPGAGVARDPTQGVGFAAALSKAPNARPFATSRADRNKTMSIHPNQLAYASRSATKAIRDVLQKLGYKCIVQQKKSIEEMSEEERYQEHIKKVYEDAIYRANKIFYGRQNSRRQEVERSAVPHQGRRR